MQKPENKTSLNSPETKVEKISRKAFSLIELSLVILIIGIIIAGLVQATSLVRKFKLSSARTLTISSPVSSITGVALWLETTQSKSFRIDSIDDTTPVGTWYDTNPQSVQSINAGQSTAANKPTYASSAISGLPALFFDGTANFLDFTSSANPTLSFLTSNNYTIFIVEQRSSAGATGTERMILSGSLGTGTGQENNLMFGYTASTTIRYGHSFDNYYNITVPAFSASSSTPKLHSIVFDSSVGKTYYNNGSQVALGAGAGTPVTTASLTTAFTSATTPRIGVSTAFATPRYYNGHIGEIIMFDRALSNTDRKDVEKYLITKWKIK